MTGQCDQCEAEAAMARDLANALLKHLNGIPIGVAYNFVGNIAVAIFSAINYVEPGDALTEFDAWARYTRGMTPIRSRARCNERDGSNDQDAALVCGARRGRMVRQERARAR
jgi:hypothetical protein